MKILGISGSLRKASWNTAALRAAAELRPEGNEFSIAEIGDLPLINQDLEQDGKYPEPVERLRHEILSADALLFATPEYNASIPAPLKNAIDWASRPANCFAGKPAAIIGVGAGAHGARAISAAPDARRAQRATARPARGFHQPWRPEIHGRRVDGSGHQGFSREHAQNLPGLCRARETLNRLQQKRQQLLAAFGTC